MLKSRHNRKGNLAAGTDSGPGFVLELELEVSEANATWLEKIFRAYRQIYNALKNEMLKRVNRCRRSAEWQAARRMPKRTEAEKQARREAFARCQRKYGVTLGEAEKAGAKLRIGSWEKLTNSRMVQNLAKRVWHSIERLRSGKANRVRFKTEDRFCSIATNRNDTGIIVKPTTGTVTIHNQVSLVYRADADNPCHRHGLTAPLKFGRIVRKEIHGRIRWYLQLVCRGIPYQPPDRVVALGEHVGLDLGPAKIAWSTGFESGQEEFCGALEPKHREIRRLQRQLDRQRRANNPENYHADGRIRKPKAGKLVWKPSARYQHTRQQLKSRWHRQREHRKSIHGYRANQLLGKGTVIHVEKAQYRAWQKRYGKAILHHAPSAFLGILTGKVTALQGGLVEINPYQTALSQHCVCGHRKKKPLSERTHRCERCGFVWSRDEVSAFLALHTTHSEGSSATNFPAAQAALPRHRHGAAGVRNQEAEVGKTDSLNPRPSGEQPDHDRACGSSERIARTKSLPPGIGHRAGVSGGNAPDRVVGCGELADGFTTPAKALNRRLGKESPPS
jgi:transposase